MVQVCNTISYEWPSFQWMDQELSILIVKQSKAEKEIYIYLEVGTELTTTSCVLTQKYENMMKRTGNHDINTSNICQGT